MIFQMKDKIMKHAQHKKLLCAAVFAVLSMCASAQTEFTGLYSCKELNASLTLNLVEKNIALKDLDFDETYGYMKGNLNGTWVVLKVKKADSKKALVRMVSDIGVDAQDVEFSLTKEGDLIMRLQGEQNIKMVADRKYVKLPKEVIFKKQ